MSRARHSKPAPTQEEQGSARDGASRLKWRIVLHLSIAAVLAIGCAVGYIHLRRYVDSEVAAGGAAPRVVFAHRPAWMTDRLAERLAGSFQPDGPRSVFDRTTLSTIERQLQANPWISEVRSLRREYRRKAGDTIEVDCDFHAPLALVASGSDYYFVDASGILLPERFTPAELPKVVFTPDGTTNIRTIEGVRAPQPRQPGQKWEGDDLAAGLELVSRLYGQPFAEEIVRVRVDNFAGRDDPREAQLVLITRRGSQIRWGRPWSATDGFVEVPPQEKVDRLRRIVTQYGQVDARQPWIDIRFDDITRPALVADPPAAHADGGH